MKHRPFGVLLLLLIALIVVLGLGRSGVARIGLGIYPEIISFTASAETVHAGEAVTLSWVTRGVESVVIESGPENAPRDRVQRLEGLSPTGTLKVQPTETTVYELTCETISSGQMCMPTKVVVKVN
jgi:hypothetical protein